MSAARAQLGVVLAGGASRRMPGGKPGAMLAGTSLLERAVATVREAGLGPVVCARAGTPLPEASATRWIEATPDDAPRHPLAGIAWALEHAAAPIVVLPVDLPFLPAAALRALAGAPSPGALLGRAGRPAALVACLYPHLAPQLWAAAASGAPALRTLTDLGVQVVDLDGLPAGPVGPAALLNVNDPATLADAEREVRRRAATLRGPGAPGGPAGLAD